MNCTATYTIQATDLNATNTGSVTNKATATNGTVTSNEATATVRQVGATGQIAPTATTCQDFKNGTAGNLTEIRYGVKNNKISNVAPGVLFYYSLVTVPAGSHTINVIQTTSPNFTLFGIQKNQAILWSSNCQSAKQREWLVHGHEQRGDHVHHRDQVRPVDRERQAEAGWQRAGDIHVHHLHRREHSLHEPGQPGTETKAVVAGHWVLQLQLAKRRPGNGSPSFAVKRHS